MYLVFFQFSYSTSTTLIRILGVYELNDIENTTKTSVKRSLGFDDFKCDTETKAKSIILQLDEKLSVILNEVFLLYGIKLIKKV